LLWRLVFVRWALIAVTAGGSVFWFLPGKTLYDRIALREEAARALRRYEGVRYHWGGENRYGIDCSGLVRRGAIEAAAREGLRTGNSLLVRKAASLWWHDLSARDMRFGGNGEVRRLMQVKALRGADHLLLYPGDFAITEDGVHAIAYLGDYLWIEADPEAGKVVVEDARTTSNSWFQRPVSIMRWRFLQAHRAKRTYKTTD